ncbi:MAG: hypothetical protein K1X75_12010 [Leptospirales bacterium]|nr:hypothetical protein [Leptospirales bacterium]
MRFLRNLVVAVLAALLSFGACSLFQKEEDDNTSLLLLLGAYLLSQAQCQNQSGLVICIPPGLRF